MFRAVGLNSSTYLTRKSAFRTRTANGLCSPIWRSALRIACCADAFRTDRTPSNIRSNVARAPSGSPIIARPTSWNAPSMDRSPVEV